MPISNIQVEKTTDEKRNETLAQNNKEKSSSAYSAEETFDNKPIQKKVQSTKKTNYNPVNGYTYNGGSFSKTVSDPNLSYINAKTTPIYTNSGDSQIDNTLKNAQKIYNIKKEYEDSAKTNPNFSETDYAKSLNAQANYLRKNGNLSDEEYGAGVTSEDVLARINYILDSPQYQISKSNTDFKSLLNEYTQKIVGELTNEEKTRAVLSYLDAQKQAESVLKPQIEQAVKDTVENENNKAVQRGMYGQIPASILSSKALADVALKGQTAINEYAQKLVEQDKQDALNEYNISLKNKQNRVNAWEQAIANANIGYNVDQNYLQNKQSREDAEKEALREQIQLDFENALKTDENNRAWAEYYLDAEDTYHDNDLADLNYGLDVSKFNRDVYEDDRDYERGVYEYDTTMAQRQAEHNDDMNLGYYKANISAAKKASSTSSSKSKNTLATKLDNAESEIQISYIGKNGQKLNPYTASEEELKNARVEPIYKISNSSVIKANGEVQHWFTQEQLDKYAAQGDLKYGYNSSGEGVYYFKDAI